MHISVFPTSYRIAQRWRLCLWLLFLPFLCNMVVHKRLNVFDRRHSSYNQNLSFCFPACLVAHSNNSPTAIRHNWIILFLPELDTRLILWEDKAWSELRFLLSLFHLKQETEGPARAFGPGVFLRLEESGLEALLPTLAAGLEAEPCEKESYEFSADRTFLTPCYVLARWMCHFNSHF